MKSNTILMAAALSVCLNVSAGQTLRDSILSDFNTLVRIVEDTHPDPYTNFGGRVFFHEKADDIRKTILASDKPSVSDLYELSSVFIAGLQDGHSFLNKPDVDKMDLSRDSLVLVKFEYVDNYLVINAIDEDAAHLLGSRLVGISSVPIDKVLENVAAFQPCENEAGRYKFMSDYFRTLDMYRKITGHKDGNIRLQLLTPQGDSVLYSPKVIHVGEFNRVNKARTPRSDEFPSGHMEWREVDGNMIFRLSSIMARENFEYQYDNGWDFYPELSYFYRNSGKEMPADTLAAIRSIPEISETFIEMLSEMKSKGIKNLIIDLRGNGGGWTPIVIPSLYLMFGDDYLQTNMDARFYRRLSELYFKKINSTIERFNQENHTAYKTGDYIMPDLGEISCPIEEKRDYL